ncbi:MAG: hypothetical protein JST82_14930 [Bacteroidetes bacterium]|nr:hypothetical protein [Bacteroidota bacterium]
MRKSILFLVAAIAICSSCKKEYTCVCYGGLSGQEHPIAIEKTTDNKARAKCQSYNQPNVMDGYYNCHIK